MIIDNIFLLLWGRNGTQMVKGYKKKFRYLLSASDIPLEKLAYCFVLMFSIISKSTPCLLKFYLHCKLPNFKCVSNASVGQGEEQKEGMGGEKGRNGSTLGVWRRCE